MCINLKSFNESFREWNKKGEEELFWWMNQEAESVPLEGIASTAVSADFHDQGTHPQVHLDLDGDFVGVVGDPNTD